MIRTEDKTDVCLKRWRMFIPLTVIVISLLAILAMGCVPDFPGGEVIVTPPIPDPLPSEEGEPEKEKAWVWHETGAMPEALSFKVMEEGVMMYLNGYESKLLKDGDDFMVLSIRKRVSLSFREEEWRVYLDGLECGVFRYE